MAGLMLLALLRLDDRVVHVGDEPDIEPADRGEAHRMRRSSRSSGTMMMSFWLTTVPVREPRPCRC